MIVFKVLSFQQPSGKGLTKTVARKEETKTDHESIENEAVD